jgi:TPR repeat protein
MNWTKCVISVILVMSAAQVAAQNLGGLSDGGGNMNARQAMEQMQQQADSAYAGGNYKQAFRLYDRLSEVGDSFATYRIATMYAKGLHFEQSQIEAYAWSYVAAQTGNQAFKDYHLAIKNQLSQAELQSARERAGQLVVQRGAFSNAVASKRALDRALRSCTGSRVGSRSDAVSISSQGCGIASEAMVSAECLRIGALGLAAINEMPERIRSVRNALDDFIEQYNPGQVQLGDFELIEAQ